MEHDQSARIAPTAWSKTLRRTTLLLAIWFLVGPVLGILLVEPLNELSLGGIPFGFWISQQGSIYVFIVLIFAYAFMADRADRESESPNPSSGPAGDSTGRGR